MPPPTVFAGELVFAGGLAVFVDELVVLLDELVDLVGELVVDVLVVEPLVLLGVLLPDEPDVEPASADAVEAPRADGEVPTELTGRCP